VWWAVGGGYFGKTNDTCEGIFQLDKNMWIATVIKLCYLALPVMNGMIFLPQLK
jgi:hypothetical protein